MNQHIDTKRFRKRKSDNLITIFIGYVLLKSITTEEETKFFDGVVVNENLQDLSNFIGPDNQLLPSEKDLIKSLINESCDSNFIFTDYTINELNFIRIYTVEIFKPLVTIAA